MDEEIKTSTGSIVPEHQKEQWHGRDFDHEANTGGERGWFEGENTPAHDLIKRHSHTGAWTYSVWTWTYCTVHCQSPLLHKLALSHEEHVALFSLMPICVCT